MIRREMLENGSVRLVSDGCRFTYESLRSGGLLITIDGNDTGQFGHATEILHAGLRDGSIESDQKNWELLASSYQQVDEPFKAIEALTEGSKKFPKSGQLDYQAATIHYSLNKPKDAYKSLKTATEKGGLSKPGSVYSFLGYVAWELGEFNEALEAINKAMSFPDAASDKQLPQLKQAVEEAIQDREAAAAAKAP